MRTRQLQEARNQVKTRFDEAASPMPKFGALLAQCPLESQDLPPRRSARLIGDEEAPPECP